MKRYEAHVKVYGSKKALGKCGLRVSLPVGLPDLKSNSILHPLHQVFNESHVCYVVVFGPVLNFAWALKTPFHDHF